MFLQVMKAIAFAALGIGTRFHALYQKIPSHSVLDSQAILYLPEANEENHISDLIVNERYTVTKDLVRCASLEIFQVMSDLLLIGCLIVLLFGCKTSIMTMIGRNTHPIYLLHLPIVSTQQTYLLIWRKTAYSESHAICNESQPK